jgi:hypothetical protein
MLFASSKDALRRQLVGISTEIQGSDISEVDHQTGTPLILMRGYISVLTLCISG